MGRPGCRELTAFAPDPYIPIRGPHLMSQVGTATGARRHDRIRICLPVSYGTESTENHGHAESIHPTDLALSSARLGERLLLCLVGQHPTRQPLLVLAPS